MGDALIDGSNKPKGLGGASLPEPRAGLAGKAQKSAGRSRAAKSSPAAAPEVPEQAVPTSAPEAPRVPTLSAMQLPQIATATKRRYPGASPSDANRPEQNRFHQTFGRALRERLKKEGLSLKDLPKSKEAAAVVQNEADARAAADEATGALRAALPALQPRAYHQALQALLKPLRERDRAQAQLKRAQADERWSGDRDATQAAQAALEDAEAKLQAAVPAWASSPEAAQALLKSVGCTLKVREAEAATNRALRVTQVQLGDRTLTKGTHFAEGAFGKVAMAMHVDSQTPRAVKVLRQKETKKIGSTEVSDRLSTRQEVSYMQAFYAPDVTLSEDPHTDKMTIEMPLALGSLDHMPADVSLVRSTGRQVFERLAEMHAAQMGHNDVKPANINVQGDGRILPADFGKAGVLGGARDPGTVQYAAPEQVSVIGQVKQLGPVTGSESDVWAAGLSLAASHQSIDGVLPFKVKDVQRQALGNIPGFENLGDEDMVPVSMAQMEGMLKEYEVWHGAHVDTASPDPLKGVLQDKSGSAWSGYFQGLHQKDPEVCTYLLTKVLLPQASQRATAAEASAFFAKLQPADSAQEQALRTRLTAQDQSPARRAAQVALKLRAELEPQ